MNIKFSTLESNDNAPMDLLLLADPAEKLIKSYLNKGICYIAVLNNDAIGTALVMETKPKTVEVMNISIKDECHNKGIVKQLLNFFIHEIKKGSLKVIEIGTGNPSVCYCIKNLVFV